MARPIKEGLDYFSHDTDVAMDDKIETLEAVYGNDGYACYFKMLERIYRAGDGVVISDAETMQKYSRKCNISDVKKFEQIINSMVKIGLFDENSWKRKKTLISNGIKKRLQVVVDKRNRMKDRYKQKVSAAETSQKVHQVKESKGKKRKVLPPKNHMISSSEIDDLKTLGYDRPGIKKHFLNRGYSESEIDKALGKEF